MTRKESDLYVELAELVRANVSGPIKRDMVITAQRKLLTQLGKSGALTKDEVEALSA